jgi:hypothetical protein
MRVAACQISLNNLGECFETLCVHSRAAAIRRRALRVFKFCRLLVRFL